MAKTVLKIFAFALAIRWGYSLLMFLILGNDALVGVDSSSYLDAGRAISAELNANTLSGWQWLGPNPHIMPLYSWLIGINAFLFGQYAALGNVLTQGLFDAGTCVLVYGMAQAIDPRYASIAGIAAAINPTQIIMAGMVYPDTPFIFFIALLFLGALRWLRAPSWTLAILMAAGLVGSSWTRILVTPFVPVLVFVLVLALIINRRFCRRHLAQLAGVLLIFGLFVAPISLRNVALYGSWALTPQGGIHLARWVVPLIWEARDGTPWVRGYEEIERRAEAVSRPTDENLFQQSQRYSKVAMDELRHVGVVAIGKAWLIGAALNLATPGIVLSPPITHLPRTGFYATPGNSSLDKIANFLFRSDNVLYSWILLTGVGGLLVARLLQLLGFAAMLGQGHWAAVLLLTSWCLFILAINGPVASPKYRLPMEPALAVLMAAGWSSLRRRHPAAPTDNNHQPSQAPLN